MTKDWIVCQIGARENYALASALHRRKALRALVTDVWAPHLGPLSLLKASLAARFRSDLSDAAVISHSLSAALHDVGSRATEPSDWRRIMARNAWFQARAISSLERLDLPGGRVALFAYSYAADRIFEFARARGWRTILGQIDPGLVEEDLVAEEARRYPELAASWRRAPEDYWAGWRRELELADTIVVNSPWSESALRAEGVATDRLKVIPLAYDPPANSSGFRRSYPERFDKNRPLRVLFLGLVNLRKGLGPLLEAARVLLEAPVEFHVVGPNQLSLPPGAINVGNIVWHGSVPRKAVDRFYRDADVMLFPTLSDGFGLTQLEARSWRLPLLVTPRCGAVIEDGVSGIMMEPGNARAIVSAIERCIDNPSWLQHASEAVAPGERHSLDDVAAALSLIG